jgi:hypothetical protein
VIGALVLKLSRIKAFGWWNFEARLSVRECEIIFATQVKYFDLQNESSL